MIFTDAFGKEQVAFGNRFQVIRKSRKISQTELAKMIGTKQPSISEIENGRSNPTFSTLIKLSHWLRVPTFELFNYQEIEAPKRLYPRLNLDQRIENEKQLFSRRLEKLIETSSRDQEDIAISAEIDPGDFSRFVNGHHNLQLISLFKISGALNIQILNLFDFRESFPVYEGSSHR